MCTPWHLLNSIKTETKKWAVFAGKQIFKLLLRVVILKKLLTTSVFLISFTSHLLYIHILYTEGTPTKAACILLSACVKVELINCRWTCRSCWVCGDEFNAASTSVNLTRTCHALVEIPCPSRFQNLWHVANYAEPGNETVWMVAPAMRGAVMDHVRRGRFVCRADWPYNNSPAIKLR